VRGAEGITEPPPGPASRSAWSKSRDLHIRNVEAVGSNPITSTNRPGQRPKVGSPELQKVPMSATWFVVEVIHLSPPV
jgi:hypothetical protein